MLYKRQGFPEEGEIVLCTVSKINPNSIFANLNEFGKSGMIHISEISPGRIRNIRDYVTENKVIVCKVLRINRERGHIDLSLRRVNETVKRNKLAEIKQEQVAEKIIENLAKNAKKDFNKAKKLHKINKISSEELFDWEFRVSEIKEDIKRFLNEDIEDKDI